MLWPCILMCCKVSIERFLRPNPGLFRNNSFVYNTMHTKEKNVSCGFNANNCSSDKFFRD